MAESSSGPEVVEAEATVMETDLTPLSRSEEWLARINERAELLAEQYRPHDIADEQDYKDSKRARADANREIRAIEQERMSMTAAIKRAVREFDEGTKRAIEPLASVIREYDKKRGEYETRWTNERITAIREAYEDFAPDIALPQEGADAPLVPFHRLLGRYGNEKKTGWTLRSVGEAKAIEAMQAAVEEIAKAERTIDSMVEEAYREGAKARYLRTLDLQATLNEETEAKAQRERVARLEAERQERMAAEAARVAAEEQRAAEDAWLEEQATAPVPEGVVRVVAPPSYEQAATVIDMGETTPGNTGRVYRDEPIPPTPPAYEPTPAPTAPPAPPTEASHPWVVAIPSATRAQILALRDWLNATGLTGGKVYSGTVYDAYMKELSNANGQ